MIVKSPENSYDIVIAGGGMVGATFAISLSKALKKAGLKILVVEAFEPSTVDPNAASFDSRSTALSFGSKEILNDSSIWVELSNKAEPIREIVISDKGRFGTARITCKEQNLEALGYVVENKDLGLILNNRLTRSESIHYFTPATIRDAAPRKSGMNLKISNGSDSHLVRSNLLVLADGGKSPICDQLGIVRARQNYNQHAIVCNVAFEKAHRGTAFERFTETGPLAVLPLRNFKNENRCSVVWSVNEQESDKFLKPNQEALLRELQGQFGQRLGRIKKLGEPHCFPLGLSIAKEQIRPSIVLLGNVAHTLHPVAGQGMNLALRDMEALVKSIEKGIKEGSNCGEMRVLQRYLENQSADQHQVITFTDNLVKLFSSNSMSKVMTRKLGLLSLELFPGLKKSFAKQAMGIGWGG